MTDQPGIYIVSLNNDEPISINSQDPRCADKVYKANKDNIKIGKTKSLKNRRDNYFKTFGEKNVNFEVVAITDEIDIAEKSIKDFIDKYRVRNPVSNRKTEWLRGIKKEEALRLALKGIRQSGCNYQLPKRDKKAYNYDVFTIIALLTLFTILIFYVAAN